ncbi:lipid II flippase MurJ, partial [Streptomyces sp. DSM 44917]
MSARSLPRQEGAGRGGGAGEAERQPGRARTLPRGDGGAGERPRRAWHGRARRPGPAGGRGEGRFVVRAAGGTALLVGAGALGGLVRDQIVAGLFGAGRAADAFLVSWTVPEFAATLLIDEAMAFVLVPAFSVALASGGTPAVRRLIAGTLPRLLLALAAATAALAAGAPLLVRLLAPGLPDPALAVDCTRLTAVTVLTFGLAGYFSAALRAHRSYLPPAAVNLAYNAGIVALALPLHAAWGVRAAAAGVATGGTLMALIQLPFFLRHIRAARPRDAVAHEPSGLGAGASSALWASTRRPAAVPGTRPGRSPAPAPASGPPGWPGPAARAVCHADEEADEGSASRSSGLAAGRRAALWRESASSADGPAGSPGGTVVAGAPGGAGPGSPPGGPAAEGVTRPPS